MVADEVTALTLSLPIQKSTIKYLYMIPILYRAHFFFANIERFYRCAGDLGGALTDVVSKVFRLSIDMDGLCCAPPKPPLRLPGSGGSAVEGAGPEFVDFSK